MLKAADIPAVIFDFDGTLADTFPGILLAWQKTFEKLSLGKVDAEIVRKAIGPTKDTYLRMILGPSYETHQEEALRLFKEVYRNECIFKTVLYPGIPELLEALSNRGVPMAIASNKPYKQILQLAEYLEFGERFNPVLGPEKVKEGKPSPDMFLLCASEWRLPLANIVNVGDTELDMIAGERAGIRRIAVLWGYTSETELLCCKPDYVAKAPADILKYLQLG